MHPGENEWKILIIVKVQNKLSRNKNLLKTIHNAEADAPNSSLKVVGYFIPRLSRLCLAVRKGRDTMKERASSESSTRLWGVFRVLEEVPSADGVLFPSSLCPGSGHQYGISFAGVWAGGKYWGYSCRHSALKCLRDLQMVHFCVYRGNNISE